MRPGTARTARYILFALLFSAAGWAAAVVFTRPSTAAAGSPVRINAALGSAFTVQGRLEDGNDLAEGPYDFELALFDDLLAGTQIGSTQAISDVPVTDGLFTLTPDFGAVFNGQALWLEIRVRPGGDPGAFTPLSPRHPLTGAPYALGLMPGIQVDTDDAANNPYVLNLTNDSIAAEGDVIKAYSTNGEGLEGYSTGDTVADSGVYGQSNGTGSGDAGVRGYASGAGAGLYGQGVGAAATSYGVIGISSSTHGVYGESNANSTTYFGGYFTGQKGVYGNAENTSGDGIYGYCAGGTSCWAARGNSVESYGVQGNTSRVDHMYGMHTSDRVYAGSGYDSPTGFSLLAQNGGEIPLAIGDVVIVAGFGESFDSEVTSPLLAVSQADNATASLVIGVVERVVQIEMVTKLEAVYQETAIPDPEGQEADDSQWLVAEERTVEYPMLQAVDGPAAPGGYVMIRVNGLAQVRVDGTGASIEVGMPLVASDHGSAVAAEAALQEAGAENALIIGHAMEPLAAGTGLIWVLVNPR